jgi:hypothetical protein
MYQSKIFTEGLRHNLKKMFHRWVMPGDGAGMFGKNVKINVTECDAAEQGGHNGEGNAMRTLRMWKRNPTGQH